MTIVVKNKETLIFDEFIFKCSIGKKGFSKKKIEGDKKTPNGTFSLQCLYYRADRISKPKTDLLCLKIKKNMGWCDDVNNKKYYNKLIKTNRMIKHEKLFRKDYKYDLLIPLNYNTKKITIGRGSAIFIHLTKNYKPTAGCVALKKKDLLILLKLINKKTKIRLG
tara:strand:- start:1190 stop:1684 length:495 start_codon:yes stop_codon:yes gene_type:complete